MSADLQASTTPDGYRRHGYRLRALAEIADTVALMVSFIGFNALVHGAFIAVGRPVPGTGSA